MKQIFLFSHGFWVDKTARWMFTDIITHFWLKNSQIFDYNKASDTGLIVSPFFTQRDILQSYVDRLTQDWSEIILICHSQWCIIPTLLKNFWNIAKCIWITPPSSLDLSRMQKNFWTRAGVIFYDDGKIKQVPRRDWTITSIPISYYDNYIEIDLESAYREFLKNIETHIIIAKDDEVLWMIESLDIFTGARSIHELDGNHDFTGEYRKWLTEYIKTLI